ncbi:two-component response regulator-like APRR7 isoform X2 [Neltuma alba]|uniref:two-component response regulator-like APRR7 isoform X2 n=1 Tax=Neltuma alba TaxID=207710 RepID=UPI0010A46884|nr:two-component response regulator-like APRR7 isoform X2 [Prosopis alba]
MGLVQINDVEGSMIPKRLVELNQHMQDEQKVRGGITGEGQDLSMEDESRVNENNINGDENNNRQMEVIEIQNHNINNQVRAVKKSNKQQIQGPLVRWERFLPVRSLKVLLVENDDSTRHVVCALLRNCGYEVEAVVDGQQAWRILEGLATNIDLVLTEVALPYLTGIGLLSKIMSHKTHKNIPVIMMSSHDSMNIVFKCLSRGAIDFLIKPLRKNELKNLWQHVWRKCHSSSGSGSESGVRTQESLKSKSGEHLDNKHDNCDEDDIGSIGLNARDKSDNGSGTQVIILQSSWTKMAVEVDSPRPMSLWEQLGDPPVGGTCAQVIHSMPKIIANNKVVTMKDGETQDNALNMVTSIDLEMTTARSTPTLQPYRQREEIPSNFDAFNNNKSSNEKENVYEKGEKEQVEQYSSAKELVGEYKNQAIGGPASIEININSNSDPILEIQCLENPNGMVSNNVEDHKNTYGNKEELLSFEFNSKSLNGTAADLGSSVQDHNVLKQSHHSAFSRYNSASHQGPTGNVGSCSPINNSSEAAKTESVQATRTYFNSMPPNNLPSNGSNNNYEQDSSSNNNFTKPSTTINKPTQKVAITCIQPSSTSLHPLQNMSLQHAAQENSDKQHMQVQHHHHHHHYHHHHHMHNMVTPKLLNQNSQQSLQIKTAAMPSLNESSTRNGSASKSHHGSNVDPGNNVAGKLGNFQEHDDNNRIAEKEDTTSLIRLEAPNITIQNRFAQREVALNKFRQKRKERCFEKRVRYQSRKKLAEQRPRVRGQFVRHAIDENKEK